jgi:predicted transcriptional regulator
LESNNWNWQKLIKKTFCFAMERPPVKLEKIEVPQMRRSKLEIYVDILKVLTRSGPLNPIHITQEYCLNDGKLKEYLGFLIKQDLIEERTVKKRHVVLAVTQRGMAVLKYFQEPVQEISGLEEE